MIREALFGPFPVIDLNDIILREIVDEDTENYFTYMNREGMENFLTADNRPKDLESARIELNYWGGLFKNKRSFYWGIAVKDTNKLIGTIGFNIISYSHLRAEISYDLDPEYWGKGIMLKSAKNVIRYAELVLRLIRIQATVIIDNQRSINLLERCGFVKEGLLKKYEVVNNEHKDYFMYAKVN